MPRYMLLTKYDVDSIGAGPMSEWDPDDITAHLEFLRALNQELIDNGELVDMQALTGPELAKIVTFDGQGSPVVTDGPYTEVKEVLAGYQLVDVESEARAIDIAARVSPRRDPAACRCGIGSRCASSWARCSSRGTCDLNRADRGPAARAGAAGPQRGRAELRRL